MTCKRYIEILETLDTGDPLIDCLPVVVPVVVVFFGFSVVGCAK